MKALWGLCEGRPEGTQGPACQLCQRSRARNICDEKNLMFRVTKANREKTRGASRGQVSRHQISVQHLQSPLYCKIMRTPYS